MVGKVSSGAFGEADWGSQNKNNIYKHIRYNYGVNITNDTGHALILDKDNANNLWKSSIEKIKTRLNLHSSY